MKNLVFANDVPLRVDGESTLGVAGGLDIQFRVGGDIMSDSTLETGKCVDCDRALTILVTPNQSLELAYTDACICGGETFRRLTVDEALNETGE